MKRDQHLLAGCQDAIGEECEHCQQEEAALAGAQELMKDVAVDVVGSIKQRGAMHSYITTPLILHATMVVVITGDCTRADSMGWLVGSGRRGRRRMLCSVSHKPEEPGLLHCLVLEQLPVELVGCLEVQDLGG